MSEKPLYCSFCGKSQHEVRKLIAGPAVFICDECTELCMDIANSSRKSTCVDGEAEYISWDLGAGQLPNATERLADALITVLRKRGLGIVLEGEDRGASVATDGDG